MNEYMNEWRRLEEKMRKNKHWLELRGKDLKRWTDGDIIMSEWMNNVGIKEYWMNKQTWIINKHSFSQRKRMTMKLQEW